MTREPRQRYLIKCTVLNKQNHGQNEWLHRLRLDAIRFVQTDVLIFLSFVQRYDDYSHSISMDKLELK